MFQTTITQEIASKMSAADAQKLIKGMVIPEAAIALQTLVEICKNPRLNPAARVRAAEVLLDRGFGRPEQTQVITTPGNGQSGVMLLPADGGEDSWQAQAEAHHTKMLALHGPLNPDPRSSS